VLVEADKRLLNFVAMKQNTGVTGIFGGDQVDSPENL
jgi:hypothetical protein